MKINVPTKFLSAINDEATTGIPPAPYVVNLLKYALNPNTSTQLIEVDALKLKRERLDRLMELAVESSGVITGAGALVQKLGMLRKMKDDSDTLVTNLKELETLILLWFRANVQAPDGTTTILLDTATFGPLPAVVTKVVYTPPSKWTSASCTLTAVYNSVEGQGSRSYTWCPRDLYGNSTVEEDAAAGVLNDVGADDDTTEEDEDAPKARRLGKARKSKAGRTVLELFASAGITLATKAWIADFESEYKIYTRRRVKVGKQYLAACSGECATSGSGDKWRKSEVTSLEVDGNPARVVMDDVYEKQREGKKGVLSVVEDIVGTEMAVWCWPLVRVFDLKRHDHYIVRASLLTPYEYNPRLIDKLVIPAKDRRVIQIVAKSAGTRIDDIIAGKSSGTVIIASGPPGTGKTLTAEVVSEAIQQPLYSVQCTQLGTNEETIEKNLALILERAQRWGAVLLIDEADVYVRRRSSDIQQNAIVGVFLRMVEYYRGVLFMTTNMSADIDDAIASRATIHVRYTKPDLAMRKALWAIQDGQVGLGVTQQECDQLAELFTSIVGRDIRRLLRLAKTMITEGESRVEVIRTVAEFTDVQETTGLTAA